MEEVGEIYFDDVSQIRMETWVRGRVALIGDAGACVSLLAGEGTGLALTEAYVMAGELHRARGDHERALAEYEKKLRPLLAVKQKSALGFAGFFAPRTEWGLFLRNWVVRLWSLPLIARLLVGRAVRDHFVLPKYDDGTGNNWTGGPQQG
jgi:2-polyprenyl-6-methoxyphenol hydroxylase-like FAD-dependent oxidoreductase